MLRTIPPRPPPATPRKPTPLALARSLSAYATYFGFLSVFDYVQSMNNTVVSMSRELRIV